MSHGAVAEERRDTDGVPVLELDGVTKHFGGVAAVAGVSVTVGRGEVVALVGNNGAGKSTIMRMVCGVHRPDSGEVRVDGKAVKFHSPRDARTAGVEAVPQELALAGYLTVAANIFLGRELRHGWGPFAPLRRRAMTKRAAELIEGFGITIPNMRARARDLSGGQQQGVAIGRAVAWGSQLVVLDEPTAALGVHETEQVENTVKKMRSSGVSAMLVSHQIDQVFRVADRVYVLRQGQLVGERVIASTTPEEIVSLITGAAGSRAA
ncbi:MAG: ATP-binding cassette domain-containing protein [Sciscionella sp.]